MSALCRIFAHNGISTAFVNPGSGRYTTDSLPLLRQPYLARQSITANTSSAQSTSAPLTANTGVKLLNVQVQSGKVVAIEVNPPNRDQTADADSPYYSGDFQLECGPGWTLSILEVSVV